MNNISRNLIAALMLHQEFQQVVRTVTDFPSSLVKSCVQM